VTDQEARAWRFMRRGDGAGETEETVQLGTAVRDSRVPLRHDSNYLFVERPATAEEIVAELRRLDLPIATIPGDELADAPQVSQRGVLMVHRGPVPEPPARATEVGREALEPIRRAYTLTQSWGTPAVADQLLAAKSLIAERLTVRFFAAIEDGEIVAAADLYLDAPDAQIEDVLTVEGRRGRGHGAAVVLTAAAEAYAAGAEFVFLVADAHDWPKDWYARLGFEPIGGYVKLAAR
jgi:N-acetylglutamate synthase-like GNAT family acetyltransferase